MRYFTLCLAVVILSMSFGVSIAEQAVPASIQFRGITWFEPEMSVKAAVDEIDGIKPSWYNAVEESARIESWYRQYSNMYADINLYDAGVILRYENASVAGYNASMQLDFAYSIKEGQVDYNTDSAEFYMAEYKITELEDMESAYSDLVNKLSQLYGTPEDNSYFNSFEDVYSPKGSLWTAADGSMVWAALYWNSYYEAYDEIKIIYAAPETDAYLMKLDTQIKNEAAANEAAQRDENSDNYDGL